MVYDTFIFLLFIYFIFSITLRQKIVSGKPRKFGSEGILSATFFIKIPHYDCCFVSLEYLNYLTFKWIPLIIASCTQSNLSLNKKKWILMVFVANNLWNISNVNKICKIRANIPPVFPYLNNLQANWFLFVTITKLLSSKKGEILWKGLKWICKHFEIYRRKDFLKAPVFRTFSKLFIIELVQGNAH